MKKSYINIIIYNISLINILHILLEFNTYCQAPLEVSQNLISFSDKVLAPLHGHFQTGNWNYNSLLIQMLFDLSQYHLHKYKICIPK